MKTFFLYDFEDTYKINVQLEQFANNDEISEQNCDQAARIFAEEYKNIIVETISQQDLPESCILLFPVMMTQDTPYFASHIDITIMGVSVLEQRVFIVNLDPELSEEYMNNDSVYQFYAKFFLMVGNYV